MSQILPAEIAVKPQCRNHKNRIGPKNRSDSESQPCSRNIFWVVSRPMWRLCNTIRTARNWWMPSPKSWPQSGALLNSTWNYNSLETTTFECPSSTHRGPKVATTVKRRPKWQRPWNDDFSTWPSLRGKLLHSQRPPSHNNCESTAVKWRLLQHRATTAKCNDREVTSLKLHNCCKFCVRFCVASWLLSFQVPFGSLWQRAFSKSQWFFELRLQSLAIYDFKVAAIRPIRVTKRDLNIAEPETQQNTIKIGIWNNNRTPSGRHISKRSCWRPPVPKVLRGKSRNTVYFVYMHIVFGFC